MEKKALEKLTKLLDWIYADTYFEAMGQAVGLLIYKTFARNSGGETGQRGSILARALNSFWSYHAAV